MEMSQLGPYSIIRELGRGGMGVVYLARDARLERDVAIKSLPEHLSASADLLARFEREAKVLAQLNHHNIASIYGLEEYEGAKYLVLEYVQGETLASRLKRGSLDIDEAVGIAVQIAAGLEAAHDAGVIHRDLKPGNVIVNEDGRGKVLDFGLARSDELAADSSLADSPTITSPIGASPTMPGIILGTAAYMSPEQARGKRVDKRTDIWTFGVVLYEMLTGASPFAGETVSDSIGAVLHKGFDLGALPVGTPARIRRVLRRCLQRDKKQRYRDIGDARLELLSGSMDEPGATPVARPGLAAGAFVVVAVLLALVGGLIFGRELLAPTPPAPRPISLAIDLAGKYELHRYARPVFSRDGRYVLLGVERNQEQCIVLRDLASGGFTEVDTGGTFLGYGFSHGGDWMFFDDADGRLRKVPLDGGPSVTICDIRYMHGGTWTDTDEILFVPDWTEPVHRVAASGGTPEPLYQKTEFQGLPPQEYMDAFPRVAPGGRWAVFHRLASPGWDNAFIMIVPVDGGEPRELIRSGAHARFLASGHLVFQREDALMAVAFDAAQGQVTSSEVSLLRGLEDNRQWGPPDFDLTESGDLIYVSGSSGKTPVEVGTLSLTGEWQSMDLELPGNSGLSINDNGTRLAILNREGGRRMMEVMELARGIARPVPGESERDIVGTPVWHPDNTTMLFGFRDIGGEWRVGRHRVGTAATDVLKQDRTQLERISPRQISRDGQTLVAEVWVENQFLGLYPIRINDQQILADELSKKILMTKRRPGSVQLSPDDLWLAYADSSSNRSEILVTSIANPSKVIQASVGGGSLATWAPDAKRLYYLNEDEEPMVMRAVDFTVTEDGDFLPEPPEVLFELDGINDVYWLDMVADGTAFYISRDIQRNQAPVLPRVVVGWVELVRDELP